MTRKHIIISGTGRAGTTFLVQLLTELGFDTGFKNAHDGILANCHAGMELDLREPSCPYIVKSPWLCDNLGDLLRANEVHIDQAIIPIRDLFSAAESRRFVSSQSPDGGTPNIVPGGVWDADRPEDQERILSEKFFKLVYVLVEYEVPITFLLFPKLVKEPAYLYSRLWFLFSKTSYPTFKDVFLQVSQPELIHDFKSE